MYAFIYSVKVGKLPYVIYNVSRLWKHWHLL